MRLIHLCAACIGPKQNYLDDTTPLLEFRRSLLECILEFLEYYFQHALQLTLFYVGQVINTVFHQHGRTCQFEVKAELSGVSA
jgi:hypothetical protein